MFSHYLAEHLECSDHLAIGLKPFFALAIEDLKNHHVALVELDIWIDPHLLLQVTEHSVDIQSLQGMSASIRCLINQMDGCLDLVFKDLG
jgi:hypothetical protein